MLKKFVALVLCFGVALCLSGCDDTGSTGNQGGAKTQNTQTAKKFSSEAEFREYAESLWVCEEKTSAQTAFKIRFLTDDLCYGWDFTYSPSESLADCIKSVIKLEEAQGQFVGDSIDFLFSGPSGDGVESWKCYVEYDISKSEITMDGEAFATVFDNGTLKCDGSIFNKDNDNMGGFITEFAAAKGALFGEKYGDLPDGFDVKYDPYSYAGKNFVITGMAVLSDIAVDADTFCIKLEPREEDEFYAEPWYVYCDRNKYGELFEYLKNAKKEDEDENFKWGARKMTLVVRSDNPDTLKFEGVKLVDCFY